jgi:hypothetical protein
MRGRGGGGDVVHRDFLLPLLALLERQLSRSRGCGRRMDRIEDQDEQIELHAHQRHEVPALECQAWPPVTASSVSIRNQCCCRAPSGRRPRSCFSSS